MQWRGKRMKDSAADITADLYRRLRNRYAGTNWCLLEGVGNGAGFGNSGWSDAIAMQTWPSKGLAVLGFEVKATRADWMRELDRPQKNGEWQTACHEWYVVTPKGTLQPGELPASWGHMVPSGKDKLRIVSRCERDQVAETVPLELMAAVFRASKKHTENIQQWDRRELRAELEEALRDDITEARQAKQAAERDLHEIQNALGHSRWDNLDSITATAKALRELDVDGVVRQGEGLVRRLVRTARTVRTALDAFGENGGASE